MREAKFYIPLPEKAVHCNLCPHHCKIEQGNRGICGVRRNIDGTLSAESYGAVTSVALDPIEKKPLRRFYPGTKILSLGSYGCNFKCGFCQNHEISMQKAPYRTLSPEDIASASLELSGGGNIGVAYTYNEPMVGYEFVIDCAQLIRKQGQKNVLITNGYVSREPLENLLSLIDAMNIDLKAFNPLFYKEIGGRFEAVQETIKTAAPLCHIEITTLIIPGKNDSEEEMRSLSEWLAGISNAIPLHISRFFPTYKWQDIRSTPIETVYRLVETARHNLKYVYAGNC